MLFDSHTHLNLAAFDSDRDIILNQYLQQGIFLINVGTNYLTSQKAVFLAEKYNNCWASVGLHPSHTFPFKRDPSEISLELNKTSVSLDYLPAETFDENYLQLLSHKKVVAIGECGLDYSYLKDLTLEQQEEYKQREKEEFIKQIQIAQKYHLPLILHLRDLYQEALVILKENNYEGKAVFHFFTGSLEDLQLILQNPYYFVGFSGVITYGHKLDEVIKNTPLDRILIETDAPYVAPLPYRGQRNEPKYVEEVAKKIAELKNLSLQEVAKQTFENALNFFNIKL